MGDPLQRRRAPARHDARSRAPVRVAAGGGADDALPPEAAGACAARLVSEPVIASTRRGHACRGDLFFYKLYGTRE